MENPAERCESATGPQNPFGYPTKYSFHGPHRTQTIWSNPSAVPKNIQKIAFGKAMVLALADRTVNIAQSKDYLAIFPNFFILGSPVSPFSHSVMPVSATRSRGVIRLYWKGEDDSIEAFCARVCNVHRSGYPLGGSRRHRSWTARLE